MNIGLINNIMNFIKNIDTKSRLFRGIIISLIVVITLILYKLRQIRIYNKKNPVFFPDGKKATEEQVIPGNKIYNPVHGYEFTIFTWLYVNNIDYKYGAYKHVLTKGENQIDIWNNRNQCPSMWLDPKENNISIVISTSKGNEYVKIEDYPLRKWFSVAVVVRNMNVESYLNGKLHTTKTLSAKPKINNGDLYVNLDNGFDGLVGTVASFVTPLSPIEIVKRHSNGPYNKNIFRRIWEGVMKSLGNPDSLVKSVDLDFTKKKCNETLNGKGEDYRGCQNKTRSGRTCQAWTENRPHCHKNTPTDKPNSGLGKHNYCRNPDGGKNIWCYTTDSKKRWEYCDPLPQKKKYKKCLVEEE